MRTRGAPRHRTASRIGWKVAAVTLLAVCLATASSAAASVELRPSSTPRHTTATCTADEQATSQAALNAYLKRIPLDRKAYFKKHRDKAHRKAFVKRQQAKLKALQAAAACRVEAPPPPTSPPPPYQSGHYAGKTSQLTDFEFDVSADGTILMSLVTGQINESCQDFNLFGGDLNVPGDLASISSDGNFKIEAAYSSKFSDGTPLQRQLTITGHLSGSSAAGTLLETTTATIQGTPESCTSNPQTWTAAKTG